MTQPYPFPVENVDPDAEHAPDPERDDSLAGATVDGTTNSAEADREASYHDDRDAEDTRATGNATDDGTYDGSETGYDGTGTPAPADTVTGAGEGTDRTATSGGTNGLDDPEMPDVITIDQVDRAAGQA